MSCMINEPEAHERGEREFNINTFLCYVLQQSSSTLTVKTIIAIQHETLTVETTEGFYPSLCNTGISV